MNYVFHKSSLKTSIQKNKTFIYRIYKSKVSSIEEILSDASKSELAVLCKIIHCGLNGIIPLSKLHWPHVPRGVKSFLKRHFKTLDIQTLERKTTSLAHLKHIKLYLPPLLHFLFKD